MLPVCLQASQARAGQAVADVRLARRGVLIQTCIVGEKGLRMTGNMSSGIRLKALTNVLAAIAMVGVYFLQAIAVSGLAVTATTTSAEARGRRGRRGRGRRGRRGRGRRGRGRGCTWWEWEAGLCW